MGECVSGHQIQRDGATYHVEPLHNKPYLINSCCNLINLEWKRSFEARKRSIAGSSENFPMSLLVLCDSDETKVVGHCKISKLPFSETKVFVETVVIHPKLRGKGLGRFLMTEVEIMAKRKSIRWIYLTTKGQEEFYRKLGYVECPQITLYGSQQNNLSEVSNTTEIIQETPSLNKKNNDNKSSTVPPPPPPPPQPSYQIDDGTGVIACNHSETQFESAITTIEKEQDEFNQSLKFTDLSMNQSSMTDESMEDSIFNEKSIQDDEKGIIKQNLMGGLQSIWNDIYDSFTNLLSHYNIGDTVLIEGKLYKYFKQNQIYVNSIRPLEWSEEIMKVSNKLRDGYSPLQEGLMTESESQTKRRFSGLMTFDNIHHLNVKYPARRAIDVPEHGPASIPQGILSETLPPHVESTITFDTFNGK